jgi:hypothetical protein
MQTHTWHHTHSSWGDAAVDGLLSGVAAGLLMAGFLVAAGIIGGESWDWVLRQFDPGLTPTPLMGAVTHLAVSGVYGILFASLWRPLARVWSHLPAWLAGLVYGLLLWLLAATVTAARANSGGDWFQGIPPAQLVAAHLLYGLCLGWLVGRLQNH